jgi:hypothetical protein
VALLLAHDSTPVAEGNLEEGTLAEVYILVAVEDSLAMTEILVAVDNPVEEGNLEEEDGLAVVYSPVAEEGNLEQEENLVVVRILPEEGSLVAAYTPVAVVLEVAFAAQPCRIVVDQD